MLQEERPRSKRRLKGLREMMTIRKAFAGLLLCGAMSGALMLASAQERTDSATPRATPPASSEIQSLLEQLRSPEPQARATAACALGRMEARAAIAIPALVALLSDGARVARSCGNEPPFEDELWAPDYPTVNETTVGEAATQALMALGSDAHDALVSVLAGNTDWRARKNASWALAHRGDRRAVEQMIVALRDEAWQVRAQAAYALFQRGGARAEVVRALIAALGDEAWQVRQQAAHALGHKGSSEVDVIEPLTNLMLRDQDARIREAAAGALWHTANARTFPALMTALRDRDERVRAAAANTLGNRVGNDEVPMLIEAWRNGDARTRAGARRALEIVRHRSQGRQTNLRPLPPGVPEE